jgi:hypothetical protein
MLVKSKPTNDPYELEALVDIRPPLIPIQDPFKAKNAKESTNSKEKESKGSKENSENKLFIVL